MSTKSDRGVLMKDGHIELVPHKEYVAGLRTLMLLAFAIGVLLTIFLVYIGYGHAIALVGSAKNCL